MPSTRPRVSIAVPVRNGQRYLSEALDSLLSQTFEDFELIIRDNASTDGTQDICRKYAAMDSRVRYERNPTDIGPANNFNACFEASRGEYFRWHAHDDLCAPQHLEKCVEALDEDETAVLAYPQTRIIDEQGNTVCDYDFKLATDSASPAHRFAELVLVNHRRHRAVEIFGLMRATALRLTPLQGSYARADSVLLVRMALLGRFVEVPARLFYSRNHPSQSMQQRPSRLQSARGSVARYLGSGPIPPPEWWDSSRRGKLNFPEWNLLRQYWESIGNAPLAPWDKMSCHLTMLQWLGCNIPKLARDIIVAAEVLTRRLADQQTARSSPSPR